MENIKKEDKLISYIDILTEEEKGYINKKLNEKIAISTHSAIRMNQRNIKLKNITSMLKNKTYFILDVRMNNKRSKNSMRIFLINTIPNTNNQYLELSIGVKKNVLITGFYLKKTSWKTIKMLSNLSMDKEAITN